MKIQARLLPTKDKSDTDITLSVSKAKTFDDCKARFKFGYIDKLPKIERDFHIFGHYLHSTLETFHRDLINDNKKDWRKALSEACSSAYKEYSDKLTGNQIKDAQLIINEYKEHLEEDGLPNIIAVEKEFNININNKVLLNGFIDRIQLDSDNVLHVIDYKTTKDPKYLKDFFQLITYCYALCLEDPSINRIRGSFVLLRHSFDYITREYTRDEVISVAEKYLQYAYDIEEEKLWRPNPQFLCKFCDFLQHCKEGQGFLIKKGMLKTGNKKPKDPFVGIRKW